MLELSGVIAGYGQVQVLHGVDFRAQAGQVTCLMGRNGVGKTTLMKTIMGLLPVQAGRIELDGVPLHSLPAHRIPAQGLAWVPQGRRLFADMTVAENLDVGSLVRGRQVAVQAQLLERFPRLAQRLQQRAGTLSGGEQQMLAIARALCLQPRVLLLDEPSEGLQPSMLTAIREVVLRLRADGVAVVLVEQRVDAVLGMADEVAFMLQGRIAETVCAADLAPGAPQFARYVGV